MNDHRASHRTARQRHRAIGGAWSIAAAPDSPMPAHRQHPHAWYVNAPAFPAQIPG